MSFLERIKQEMTDKRVRGRLKVTVSRPDLAELIHHFEQLDTAARAEAGNPHDLEHQLHITLEALFIKDKSSEDILLAVAETLEPLINEKMKKNRANNQGIDKQRRSIESTW